MRFLFRPPATEAAGLLALPWARPLADWPGDVLLDVPQRGVSRHVVRFVAADGAEGGRSAYALKEMPEELARKEYALLTGFAEEGLPAVEVLGVCVDRGEGLPAVLVTRYLDWSVSSRYLFSSGRVALGSPSVAQLLEAMAALLVRLHLAGVVWGDCSLSNTLFCADAGRPSAHLVDAETVERYPFLTGEQRRADVALAVARVAAELADLAARGLLPAGVDPGVTAEGLRAAHDALWAEVTREEPLAPEDPRQQVEQRVRQLGDLGFDAGEVELVTDAGGSRLRVRTRVSGPDRHRRELARLTGLEAGENQARRLLHDLHRHRAELERRTGAPVPEEVAGQRWLAEVWAPVVEAAPPELTGRLAPAELFHEVLEHRWFLSEQAGGDVGTAAAARSYVRTVLPRTPQVSGRAAVLARTAP
ncbi:DUF4032 domain-containing protein [Geodermatophilus sp. SYSU D00758]